MNLIQLAVSERKRQLENIEALRLARDVSSMSFVTLAHNEYLDDITMLENIELFPVWDEYYTTQNVMTVVSDEGKLYRNGVPIEHPSQNIKPSLDLLGTVWVLVGNSREEYPMWVQPVGSHDAYEPMARVSHRDKRWINTHTAPNSWEPGVFGWTEVL